MKITNDIRSMFLIACVAFVVFANTLGGDFVYDDNRQILRNTLIQTPANYGTALTSDVWAFKGDGTIAASNYYRPVFTGVSIVLWKLFGAKPMGWHFFNILLHAFVSVLVFALLRRWNISTTASLIAGLIFAVHPVHAESVAWIAGAPDLLCAAGLFGAFVLFEKALSNSSTLSLAGAVVCYLAALGSKEVALAALPVFLVQSLRGESLQKDSILKLVPFAVAAVLFFIVRWRVIGAFALPVENPPTLSEALLSLPSVFLFYLRQIFFPLTFAENYPLRPVPGITAAGVIAPLLLMIAVAATIFAVVRRRAASWPAVAIFFLTLLPAFNLTAFPADQIVHDRYLYIPLFGVAAALAFGLDALTETRFHRAAVVIAALVCVPLGVRTLVYNRIWSSELALWTATAAVDPQSASTLVNYASALSSAGQINASIDAYNRAAAISTQPLIFYGRGRNLMASGRFDEAEADFKRVTDMPNEKINAYTLYQAYEALALLLSQRGRFDEAAANLKNARQRLPVYNAALTEKLAIVLYQANDKTQALTELESVRVQARRELLPESKAVFLRLGMLYAEFGRRDEARRALGEFLTLTESTADAAQLPNRAQAANLLQNLK